MKKRIGIILVIVLVFFTFVNIPGVALYFLFPMPDEAKTDSICFLAPELTWNSTVEDVTEYFGEPFESVEIKGDVFWGGTKSDVFNAVFENRSMKVQTTRKSFSVFMLLRRKRVFEYKFTIKCNDVRDEKIVYDMLCERLIESRASDNRFHYDKEGNVLTAVRYYGPFWSGDDAEYQIEYSEGGAAEVVFKISSVFDL